MSKKIGMQLRQARESMGMTLMDVARKTNIELKYLMAIEKGEWERLPNVIYARAYVKNYAQLVGERVRIAQPSRRRSVNTNTIESTHAQKNLHSDTIHTTKRRIAKQIQAEVIDSDHKKTPRKVEMPTNVPDPEEIGIHDKTNKVKKAADRSQTLPSRKQRAQMKNRGNKTEDQWGVWYTRALIVSGVLLVLGLSYFFYLKMTSPAGIPLA